MNSLLRMIGFASVTFWTLLLAATLATPHAYAYPDPGVQPTCLDCYECVADLDLPCDRLYWTACKKAPALCNCSYNNNNPVCYKPPQEP